jgi:hypothetical protein
MIIKINKNSEPEITRNFEQYAVKRENVIMLTKITVQEKETDNELIHRVSELQKRGKMYNRSL